MITKLEDILAPTRAEMSTRYLAGVKGRPKRKADQLIAIYEQIVYKIWVRRRPATLWAATACYRDSFTFLHVQY
jgi:hypothetical protein